MAFKASIKLVVLFSLLAAGFIVPAIAKPCGPTRINDSRPGATSAQTTSTALGPFDITCSGAAISGDLDVQTGGAVKLALEQQTDSGWKQVRVGNYINYTAQPGRYRFVVTYTGKIGVARWTLKYRLPIG